MRHLLLKPEATIQTSMKVSTQSNKQTNNTISEIIWHHYENICPKTWSWSMSKLLLYCKHTAAHFHLFIKVTQQKKLWAQKAKDSQVLTTSSTWVNYSLKSWGLQACKRSYSCNKITTTWIKVIYPKYSEHWPFIVAHTIDCVCSKMLNQGLNHGLFLSLFKLIPCPIHWIVYVLAYLNFIFEF